jgi:protein TonB
MIPILKLVANVQQTHTYTAETVYQKNVYDLVPQHVLPTNDSKQARSYLMLTLVIFAHVAGLAWLINAKSTLPVIKEPQPMLVSLLSSPAPDPEVVPLVPTPPQPLVKKQQPIVKNLQPIPKPVAAEPEVKQVVAMAEALPSPVTPVVETKAPEVAEAPQPKVEPEPVIEPPRFGAAYLHNPPPDYPSIARRMGEQGRVLLRVLVSTKGDAESVQLESSSGSDRLDRSAIEAVKKWRFIPAKRSNQAISAYVLVPVKFSIES